MNTPKAPRSDVIEDAGVQLPTERTHATDGDSFEGVRDNEQLGRPRTEMLREVEEIAPPAAEEMEPTPLEEI